MPLAVTNYREIERNKTHINKDKKAGKALRKNIPSHCWQSLFSQWTPMDIITVPLNKGKVIWTLKLIKTNLKWGDTHLIYKGTKLRAQGRNLSTYSQILLLYNCTQVVKSAKSKSTSSCSQTKELVDLHKPREELRGQSGGPQGMLTSFQEAEQTHCSSDVPLSLSSEYSVPLEYILVVGVHGDDFLRTTSTSWTSFTWLLSWAPAPFQEGISSYLQRSLHPGP